MAQDYYPLADLVSLAQQAGFQGDAAITAAAIAGAESGGNPNAFNGNAATGDKSYGLWQINMLGDLGPARRRQFGLSSDEQLYDPLTNARAAYAISGGGTNFSAWSTYKRAFSASGQLDPSSQYAKQLAAITGDPGAATGLKGLPINIPGNPLNGAVDAAQGLAGDIGSVLSALTGKGLLKIILIGVAAAGGLALIVTGGLRTVGVDKSTVTQAAAVAA